MKKLELPLNIYVHICYYMITGRDKEENKMMTLVIEHDNGKAGQRGFTDYQISEKAEVVEVINEYEAKGIFIYSANFCQL